MSLAFKPRILLSECLGVRPVRYDGNIIFDNFVEVLKKYVEVVPVCPEVGIGLEVPREPLVLYEENNNVELIDTVTGSKHSKEIEEFVRRLSDKLLVDGVLLKAASPSCGVGDAKIYGPGRKVLRKGDGFFTSLLRRHMPCIPLESEKRLYAYEIRRRFLTRVFSLAELRATLSTIKSYEDLADFHRRYKYLIMLHSPATLKSLGRLVASRRKYEITDFTSKYKDMFVKALCRNPSKRSYVNVFMHIYGHLKKELEPSERKYVVNLIEKYGVGSESLKTVMTYLRGFIHRFRSTYLAEQRFFSPYPEELDYVGLEPE